MLAIPDDNQHAVTKLF